MQQEGTSIPTIAESDPQESSYLLSFWEDSDVFAFTPVPIYSPKKVSSRRSSIASIILIVLMIIYAFFTIVTFLVHNVPKTISKRESIGNQAFTMPNIALTVLPNLSYGVSFVDQTYYGVNISQGVVYKGLKQPKTETMLGTDYNCNVEWLSDMNFSSFVCPSQLGKIEGSPFASDEFRYIKVDVFKCVNGSHPNIVCKNEEAIRKTLRTARITLFIQQDPDFYKTNMDEFRALFYYPTFQFTQKYDVYLRKETIKKSPDFFYDFRKKSKHALFYDREKTYVSELIPGQENLLLTLWLRLSEEETIQEQMPENVMDILGKWGALWGFLLSAGALYFMAYNRRKFYKQNTDFQHFGHLTKRFGTPKSKCEIDLEMRQI